MPSRITSPDEAKPDFLITPNECQRRLAIGQTTYYEWVRRGWLHPISFSKRLHRLRASEVDALIDEMQKGGAK